MKELKEEGIKQGRDGREEGKEMKRKRRKKKRERREGERERTTFSKLVFAISIAYCVG